MQFVRTYVQKIKRKGINMLTIYDLKNNVMLKQPDFFKLVEGYDSFKGVSFVGSFKIIEKELLPALNRLI